MSEQETYPWVSGCEQCQGGDLDPLLSEAFLMSTYIVLAIVTKLQVLS